jgi:hypothetical protein
MEKLREAAKKSEDPKVEQTDVSGGSGKGEVTGKIVKSKSSNSSSTEQDLDTFLLGDLEDSDEAPGILFKSLLRYEYRNMQFSMAFQILFIGSVTEIVHIVYVHKRECLPLLRL